MMHTAEQSVFPQSVFPNDEKIPTSLKDSSTSTFATANMSFSTAAASSSTIGVYGTGEANGIRATIVGGQRLLDSGHFSVEQSMPKIKKKKKKKVKEGRGEKKDSKKKRKSKSSKRKSAAPSSSLINENNEILGDGLWVAASDESDLFAADNTWENDARFDDDASWMVHPEMTQPDQQDTFARPKKAPASHQHQSDVQRTAEEFLLLDSTAAKMPDIIRTPTSNGNALESFADENMSVLTGDELHLSAFVQPKNHDERRNTMMVAAKQALSSRSDNGDVNEVPNTLIIKYMMAMGANRGVAQELASSFQLEQQQQEDQIRRVPGQLRDSSPNEQPVPASAGRHMQSGATILSNKLSGAEHGHDSISDNRDTEPGPRNSISNNCDCIATSRQQHSSYITDACVSIPDQQPGSSYSVGGSVATPAVVHPTTKILEATPVEDDIESVLPIAYASGVEPISFKSIINEHPLHFLFCLGVLVMVGIIVGILQITILDAAAQNADGRSPSTMLETWVPTMTPSLAPTFINQNILLAAAQLSGVEVFSKSSSPQFKAIAWMSSVDQMETGGLGRQDFAQRYALTVMYFSLHGENWIHQENWLAADQHECEWSSGILCRPGSLIVKKFDATRNNLHGTIPPEIGLLSSSESFIFPKNNVIGPIPSSIGKVTSLSTLDLSDNKISGAIPVSLESAVDLATVNLSDNQLTSTIPIEFYNLKFLRTVLLTSNKLSGSIPEALDKLSSLVTLDLRKNQFTGPLPFDLDRMTNLHFILLDHNRFTGSIPPISFSMARAHTISISHNLFSGKFARHSSLQSAGIDPAELTLTHVDLSYNLLSGQIHQLLGFLPTLRYLDLSGNRFEGTFPSNVGFDSIEYLALGNNTLTGTVPVGHATLKHLDFSNNDLRHGVPEALCECPNLEFLILSGNQLESTIPPCIGTRLLHLRDLELANCSLNSTIPPVLGQLSDLSILDLSSNSLSSTIPKEMGDLANIEHFKLQGNSLTGPIPPELGNLVDLIALNLTENALTGTFPSDLQELEKLENLLLQGNTDLSGQIPPGLCESRVLNLLAENIGCNIACDCCDDADQVCNMN